LAQRAEAVWKAMVMPILVVQGAESNILPSDLALRMVRRNPRATVYEMVGCGHAPTLMTDDQIDVIANFINAP